MYESMTYEVIMQKMLERVPNSFDKREGAIIFDALAPAAAELAQLYTELDVVLNQTFADTATDKYLEKRCAERGIYRKPATYAVVKGKFTPATVDVSKQRFNCGIYNYTVTEALEEAGTYLLVCETSGKVPNTVSGQLIPMEYIPGLESAEITMISILGTDAEDDESLRERYFESIQNQTFGGNAADYIQKTKAIAGVAGVKVTPVWNGGGTVKLTIIAADDVALKDGFIAAVQEEIDKIAPIGHLVTVEGAVGKTIDIETVIEFETGYGWETSSEEINKAIEEYLLSLAEKWEDEENLVVRISGIKRAILSCEGVLDVGNTKLTDANVNVNLQLAANEFPVKGEVLNVS